MPTLRKCSKPSCREYIDYRKSYCSTHLKEFNNTYNKQVRCNKDNKQYADFYASKEWKNARNNYINKHPLCEECLYNKEIKSGKVVDHVEEIRDDWSRRLDESNFRSLCHSCHNKKTKRVSKERYKKG